MAAPPTRWGIAGAGAISSDFVKATKLLPSSEHKFCAVAARQQSRADEFARNHDIPISYGSYKELVQDKEIDIVYVGVIHTEHFVVCKLMLEGGKNVICEKPLTINAKQARELAALAKKSNVFFMEAVWSRCFPAYEQLRKELSNKTIGDLKFIEIDFGQPVSHIPRIRDLQLGGGACLDLGMYAVQFATMIFEKMPEKIVSTGIINDTGADETESVTLHYSGGCIAQLNISSTCWMRNTAVIYGSKGMLELPRFWCPDKLITPDKTFEFPIPKSPSPVKYIVSEGLMYEAQSVRTSLQQGQKENPLMPLNHTIMDMDILDAVRRQLGVRYKEDQE